MKVFALLFLVVGFSTQARAQGVTQVSIIEFGDFECPYTQRAIAITDQITADYGSKVQIVYKNFPLTTIHPYAQSAALASICGGQMGQYQGMFDQLFADQANLGQATYDTIAKSLGLDLPTFDACLTSQSALDALNADIALGNSYKINETPSFILSNGKRSVQIIGAYPYPTFKAQIDSLLAN